jgi:hypothetical protein
MRRLASACVGASACYVVASRAAAVQREAGAGNSTAAGRPALVFRYDCEATPPPGVGLLGSVAHTSLARALHVASSCGLAMREAVT